MKTLANPKVTVSPDGKSGSMTFDIVDKNYSQLLVQRVTIGHLNPNNLRHPRHVQISNEGIFVKIFGQGFAMDVDDVVQIAAQINPKTSFAPVLLKQDAPYSVKVASELPVTYQWQQSDKIKPIPVDAKSGQKPVPPVWTDIEGQTSDVLDVSKIVKGMFVRCVVANVVGSTIGEPKLIK